MGNVVKPKISEFSSDNSLGTFSYSSKNTQAVSFTNMSNEQKINYDYADDSKVVSADIKNFDAEDILGTYSYVSKIDSAINDSANIGNAIDESNGTVAGEKLRSIVEKQAEQKAKQEAEQKAKQEAEQKAKQEAEQKAKQEAEQKAKQEAEQKAKQEAEQKAKDEAEQKVKEKVIQNYSGNKANLKSGTTTISTSEPVAHGKEYNISDSDLAYLAYIAKREQGTVEGAKVELSLMVNLYEKNKSRYSSVQDYVRHSGWFANSSSYSYPGDSYVDAAKDVLREGNRYLSTDVVEHDCLSDISRISTGSVRDRSDYIPGETVIYNVYGAKYVFVGFAPNGGDPFGYMVK